MKLERIQKRNAAEVQPGPMVYWMSRDQRARDNWALLFTQALATKYSSPVEVVFCLVPTFLGATLRHYDFMLKGLQEVALNLREYHIPFTLLFGEPHTVLPKFLKDKKAGALVTDFSPLRINREWKKALDTKIDQAFFEVDAHNIAPCWFASPKQEFAARTFRPKIMAVVKDFLEPFPALKKQSYSLGEPINWKAAYKKITVDEAVPPVTWITPGEAAAKKALNHFISTKLSEYENDRNDPSTAGQSDLSPYFHFGHLAPARVALEIYKKSGAHRGATAFLEEMVVRRELSDNFCFYNQAYDSFTGFPAWAQKTLNEHRLDQRQIYTLSELEHSKTHDDLWNAAQTEMVVRGKMHGYLRMYWAKKILEWTTSPEQALEYAIYLNDRYELDGRDPNGYTGIAWSIGGVHDRPWFNRPIFGSVRYMSRESTGKKCNATKYIEKINTLQSQPI
jgi:deoxyribodipyrimidine photo-lyase